MPRALIFPVQQSNQLSSKITIEIESGRPLMICWEGPEEKSKMGLFFPRKCLFFPGEGPPRFFFLDFLRPPQIINGRPLRLSCTSTRNNRFRRKLPALFLFLKITHIMWHKMSMFNAQFLPESQSVFSVLHQAVCDVQRSFRESKPKMIKHHDASLLFELG